MNAKAAQGGSHFGPWNPGIRSPVPEALRAYCTIFLPDNVFTSLRTAAELHDLTGLEMSELVAFRPRRLLLHELLIRVTADLGVPDGERIEDLGINFRQMTRVLLARLEPHANSIIASVDKLRQQLKAHIDDELLLMTPRRAVAVSMQDGVLTRFRKFARVRRAKVAIPAASGDWMQAFLAGWEKNALATQDELKRSSYRALLRVVAALFRRHGAPWGSTELIAAIALDLASNEAASDLIGRAIEPLLLRAAADEDYSILPAQVRPVIMNTKGPSASGKSTLRPLQKQLAGTIGVNWDEFALISPDIWRKQLLDYEGLGENYKYAGSFTGEELQIVDQKLDRYMARKAERGQMSHLLIDRFRFDSFAPESAEAGSNLLTRFGRVIYLFFMVTPPASLVERAWNRGLDVGRYKAVDDTLAHGAEAYSGMPELFFTWVQRSDKRVHFEFLDNSVPRGVRPRTVAFGDNRTLNVLDIKCMLNIERYRRVNVRATAKELLYTDATQLAPQRNMSFLCQCITRFSDVNFADQRSGRVFLSLRAGEPIWADAAALEHAFVEGDTRAALEATAARLTERGIPTTGTRYLQDAHEVQHRPTLGDWGGGG